MTQTSRLLPRRVWLAVLLAGALLLAACGDSDDDDASTETTAATDETEAPAETTAAPAETEAPAETTEAAEGGASGEVFISGSSTVEPISIRVAEMFETVNPDVSVTVEGPGTGDGFQKFCAGETDISDASRAISDEEIALCGDAGIEYVELKVGIDGLSVITNPANELACLTFADLYALVGPESTGFANWSDGQALAAELGSATTFPDASLDITAPGTESGTYDSFIEIALADIAEERGQEETTRPDYTSAADDNLIIANAEGSESAFGWVGFAFAEAAGDSIKEFEIDGGDGCVAPTPETIASNEYPISRDLFIYVNTAKAAENPGLVEYVDFYVTEGLATAVSEVGYVPLTDDAQAETQAAWEGAAPA
jgi:phosphate transport system substrate-binding protein